MTMGIRSPHVVKLFALSANDAGVLKHPLPSEIFGFHAQQSAEKLLKAWLSACQVAYPFSHELEDLLKLLEDQREFLPALPCPLLSLQPFAVTMRYDFGPPLSDEEKSQIMTSLEMLREYVLGRVLALEARNLPPVGP